MMEEQKPIGYILHIKEGREHPQQEQRIFSARIVRCSDGEEGFVGICPKESANQMMEVCIEKLEQMRVGQTGPREAYLIIETGCTRNQMQEHSW